MEKIEKMTDSRTVLKLLRRRTVLKKSDQNYLKWSIEEPVGYVAKEVN